MIITKTPLRISFTGGGTDLKSYYEQYGGAVLSMTIDKYIYVIVKKNDFDKKIILSYGDYFESVDNVNDLSHQITQACLKETNIQSSVQICSFSDVPAGTGLGSSSCFTVGLLNALWAYKGIHKSPKELAEEACKIEIDILKAPIGKQDQYASAFGGINNFIFNKDDSVSIENINIDFNSINENLLMFYIGGSRAANKILKEQNNKTNENIPTLNKMKNLTQVLKEDLRLNKKVTNTLGIILQQGWELKKTLASGISNDRINKIYDLGISSGAIGGKLLGAGGTGFILFYVPKAFQEKVKNSLSDYQIVPITFEKNGSSIIYE